MYKKVCVIFLLFITIKFEFTDEDEQLLQHIRYKMQYYSCKYSKILYETFTGQKQLNGLQNAIQASQSINKYCPYMKFSCCKENMIEKFYQKFDQTFEPVKQYYQKVRNELLKIEQLKKYIEEDLFNQKIHNDVYESCQVGSYMNIKNRIIEIDQKLPEIIEIVEEYQNFLQQFYTSIICAVCDGEDIQFFSEIPENNQGNFTLDYQQCFEMFDQQIKQYEIFQFNYQVFQIISDVFCLYRVEIQNFYKEEDVVASKSKTVKNLQECQSQRNNFSNVFHCNLLCQANLNILEWTEGYTQRKFANLNSQYIQILSNQKKINKTNNFDINNINQIYENWTLVEKKRWLEFNGKNI